MDRDMEITRGSGSVFEDLDRPDAGEKKIKVRLAIAINRAIKARGLNQTEAAKVMGTVQPKVSELANYRLNGFSVGKLLLFLTGLGCNVAVNIIPTHGQGHIVVHELESA